ncbi:M50 family metallopeptidase [Deinococcus peraridilitoris]|uniref:Putative membrane-associated Zn-dependent protease n=1 Tax=Deinococcus peraridilitoris (strain DSM 19664 / LMG 22246 / CIP 109416 / KR-200) TaxID=937777 RepID=L0A734_DEIPD|nr:M50 family metallopeptidase [Deinococcus peraridilitoris]AFZ68865.1 putative membrane-associated Zn-dependent protease [Deinococcus peraridilitoris DSM 19664]
MSGTGISIALWLLIIVVATFWHELGHYWAARAQGVGVKSFSIGMGPILVRWRSGGTEWRLSALPIGGYVEIDGMAPTVSERGELRAPTTGYAGLGAPGKIAILLAGPLFNWILAIALLAGNYAAQGVVTPLNDRARVASVAPNSEAQRLGLREGDVIVAINGRDIPESYTVDGQPRPGFRQVQDALALDGPKTFTVERDGRRREVSFNWQARENGERRLLGIGYGEDRKVEQVAVPAAIAAAARTSVAVIPQAVGAFAGLFQRMLTLDLQGNGEVVGPIGTVGIVGQAAQAGVWTVVGIMALINLSLALFNLLPIPGLDGGRIFLVLVQALLRRPLTFQQENFINLTGFALVMLLMLFVVFSDVARFF